LKLAITQINVFFLWHFECNSTIHSVQKQSQNVSFLSERPILSVSEITSHRMLPVMFRFEMFTFFLNIWENVIHVFLGSFLFLQKRENVKIVTIVFWTVDRQVIKVFFDC
jgi:hypothetical protein